VHVDDSKEARRKEKGGANEKGRKMAETAENGADSCCEQCRRSVELWWRGVSGRKACEARFCAQPSQNDADQSLADSSQTPLNASPVPSDPLSPLLTLILAPGKPLTPLLPVDGRTARLLPCVSALEDSSDKLRLLCELYRAVSSIRTSSRGGRGGVEKGRRKKGD
jgi:hypothetical protein